MLAVLTPEQMAAADAATIAAGTPSSTLMERAGRAVARAAVRLAGGAYGRRFLILCGKGNNGGDGLVAARLLAAQGAAPAVVFFGDPGDLRGDPARNFARLPSSVRVLRYEPEAFQRELGRAELIIDALVGTGFAGTLGGDLAAAVGAANDSAKPVLAVDIPSGVAGATGQVDGPAIRAHATVTMAALKLGLVLVPGCDHTGAVEVADIGIAVPHPGLAPESEVIGAPGPDDVARALGKRPHEAHKRSVGTVMIVAGSVSMPGAAALAAAAALRSGAGLVSLATVEPVAHQMHAKIPEATTLLLPATPTGSIAAAALQPILERAETVDAVALGPGLTTNPETASLIRTLAERIQKPLVIDADGLNALAEHPEVLARRSLPTVITPHPGEMARLAATSSKAVQADRLGIARQMARTLSATVVLKGYRSVVAAPNGEVVVITTGGPALATGGTGDVLTGITVALLAGGPTGGQPFPAAWAASWVHGRAGDLLGARIGSRGALAGDLPAAVAEVMHELEGER
ncbi:MAG: NAD(P)H-hydrate dehydratase [Actinomycetota bacterium]